MKGENVTLSKNSPWWRGPWFLFDKNQSYNGSNYCENKETLPDSFTYEFKRETKYKATSSRVEHLPIVIVIDVKSYSNAIKLFRVTALMIRFAKNLFRKIKGGNLNMNSYVEAKKIYEAKVHWVKTFITNITDE